MLQKIKHYGSVAWKIAKMSIQEDIEYPLGLLGWVVANVFQFVVGFAMIKFVIAEFGDLNGWHFGEIAFMYGLGIISHSISILLFVQTWGMGWHIINGAFDRFMVRPMSVLFQFLFMYVNLIGVADAVPGLMIFAYGCVQVNFQWSLANLLSVLVTIFGATLIRGGIYMIFGCTCFWTNSPNQFVPLCQQMFDKTTMYPLSMYPRVLQGVFTFLLPLGFISYYPASDLLDKVGRFVFPGGAALFTLGSGVIVYLIACLLFKLGLRRYESAGN